MSWRETQLKWYKGDTIQQDYELEQFVLDQNISSITYLGDSCYLKSIIGKEIPDGQLYVHIINHPSKLSDITNISNHILKNSVSVKFLYLAINKFILHPEPQSDVVDDYDDAIYNYVTTHVDSKLIKYHSGKIDGGVKFNWVHPLTRFYFSK